MPVSNLPFSVPIKELSINRDLINPRFNSYKLAPDADFGIRSCNLSEWGPIQTLKLNENDYSFAHVSMLASMNSLMLSPDGSQVYFISTREGKIVQSSIVNGKIDLSTVFTLSQYSSKFSYVSVSFVKSSSLVIISHSCLNESNRYDLIFSIVEAENKSEWKLIKTVKFDPVDCSNSQSITFKQSSHVHLLNSIVVESKLSFVYGIVIENTSSLSNGSSKFSCLLQSVTFENQNGWRLLESSRKCFHEYGTVWPKLVELEAVDELNLIIVSNKIMKLVDGLELKPILVDCHNQDGPSTENLLDSSSKPTPNSQFNLNNQLEDVDDAEMNEVQLLQRVSIETGSLLDHYDLTFQHVLFILPCFNSNSIQIVVRHEVDALVYELTSSGPSFIAKHVGTFDAFGYIQASKVNRVFMSMGQVVDGSSYPCAVIAESTSTLYFYWKAPSANEGRQFIARLESTANSRNNAKLIGLQALKMEQNGEQGYRFELFISTEHELFAIQNERL